MKRRNFINGTLLVAGASMLPGCTHNSVSDKINSLYYPPSLTGLRGSHPGSNTHAHDRAWTKKSNWGPTTKLEESYDLVVVGGGISGLSAAYFYQQKHGKGKKVLILDNHDDFGGHAKRNEHKIDGKTLISYGGSQSIVEPKNGSKVVHDLLKDVGIDIKRFISAYDRDFYKKNNLGSVTYFNKKIFGEDKVVKHPYCNYPNYIEGLLAGKLSNNAAAKEAPLSKKGKQQLLKVLNGGLHKINVPKKELNTYIRSHSYFDYLKNTLGVNDPGVLRMARHSALDWAVSGTDIMNIETAKSSGALGFIPKVVYDKDNPYIYHFPDGNASITRALVKKMIPSIAEGKNAEELVLSKFNYSELDRLNNSVRIRLNSTVINVQHGGDPKNSSEVYIKYIKDNKSNMIRAKNVVMACYNMMIPHIVSGLPEEQVAALRRSVKIPLQYTTVGLKNWRAIKEIQMGMAMSPGNMHQVVMMDFPVSMGAYEFTKTPNDPCAIQMIACPFGAIAGTPPIEQFREARYKMLSLQLEDYENEVRAHLSGMLPQGLFEFDRDVESLTVNRWAHGYVYSGSRLYDSDLRGMAKIGRQPFGRITIANIDSAPSSYAHVAIKQAWRAVKELG